MHAHPSAKTSEPAAVVWRTQTRHAVASAAATPLSPPPRLPASPPTIAHRHSSAFPDFCFSLFAAPCHHSVPQSARAGSLLQDAVARHSMPGARGASWTAPALWRFVECCQTRRLGNCRRRCLSTRCELGQLALRDSRPGARGDGSQRLQQIRNEVPANDHLTVLIKFLVGHARKSAVGAE